MSKFVPSPQLRWVMREVLTPFGRLHNLRAQVLQQKWVIMNNWSEQAQEWRDVPIIQEEDHDNQTSYRRKIMTIKHLYDEIAKELADLYPSTGVNSEFTRGVYSGLNAVALSLARAFKRDNPNFDTEKFLLACTKGRS